VALSAKATQEFVPIKEVREGTIVLKDGALRAIIAVSSINLALKSGDEQVATIQQFQSFLNSIDFPIQIVVQSRRLDIRPYLLTLEENMKNQREPLLKLQTAGYISFIREFTEQVSIMRKYFYVVVPYEEAVINGKKGVLGGLFSRKEPRGSKRAEEEASFEEKRTQLDERVSVIASGLQSCGARTERLKTEATIELFYKTFNPGDIQPAIKMAAEGLIQ
jgi:type IV secretory pathway VirB4 component